MISSCLCVQDDGAPQAVFSSRGLWLPSHGAQRLQSNSSPSSVDGASTTLRGGHQDHVQLHTPAACVLRHTPGVGAAVWTVQRDQLWGLMLAEGHCPTSHQAKRQDFLVFLQLSNSCPTLRLQHTLSHLKHAPFWPSLFSMLPPLYKVGVQTRYTGHISHFCEFNIFAILWGVLRLDDW